MSKKKIKEQISLIKEKLKTVKDSEQIEDLKSQLTELEKQLGTSMAKKIIMWITAGSMIAGLVYTVLDIVLMVL